MELITSSETLDFLSKSCPRAWVKRMLLWMIFRNEIDAYFLEARSIARTRVFAILLDALKVDAFGPKKDELIREQFSTEMAERLIAANEIDELEDFVEEWEKCEEPQQVSCGYFVYATRTSWEEGTVQATILADDARDERLFWDTDSLLHSEFAHADFDVTLKGLCFEREKIEMLQPNIELPLPTGEHQAERPRLGRPRTWDWESATTHLLTVAQTPDGLPTGPGAQAQIERLVADWFMISTGNTPAASQVRQHVTKILRVLKKPKSS
ncbi:hypothetical protein [Methylocapsa palsarum]|uniref:Uncharacterized protein n=1 Tax=Methylocapsa palsarum TaxID=1612308 RepID=A0A1I3ZPI2_9HYPH|nr:hypothetical protein [Methylocapsa palsarum]SFK45820.1 hypothetical protein SAMN05444581_10883 [Methylocapsa palsarum]